MVKLKTNKNSIQYRNFVWVLGDNSNNKTNNKTLPMNLVENSTRSADHEGKVRKFFVSFKNKKALFTKLSDSSDATTNFKNYESEFSQKN